MDHKTTLSLPTNLPQQFWIKAKEGTSRPGNLVAQVLMELINFILLREKTKRL